MTLSCLVTAFWISWHGLAQLNFGYATGYDLLNIDAHIQRFAPTNQYRKGFENTSREQHMTLFGEIVEAIQNNGKGLQDIRYYAATKGSSSTASTLLREPEVVHLQDVANLISFFNKAGITCILLLIILGVLYRYLGWKPPTVKQILSGTIITLLVVGVFLILVGPTASFYWLHTKIFPENHQWFFYYQESLMTTLMKAPDLFGFIAVLWVTAALTLFGLEQYLLQKLLQANR